MEEIYFANPVYKNYDSITYSGKGLMRDFGLKAKKIVIGMPDIWEHLVEVPGRNGPIDMTDFSGRPAFKSRQINISLDKEESYDDWLTKSDNMINHLYGNRFNIVVGSDDKHYFTGRCLINMTKENGVITDHDFIVKCDPMRTIIPLLSDLYTDVETGITETGQIYTVSTYIGKYAYDLRVIFEKLEGAAASLVIWKNGQTKTYNMSSSPFSLSTLPYDGNVQLRLYNLTKFTLMLENKEL